jgi:Holliday junction DNA helicase RuvB
MYIKPRIIDLITPIVNSLKASSNNHHCLFYGPPGTGKTTIAEQIAIAADRWILSVIAATLTKKNIDTYIKSAIKYKSIFFIDEIHNIDIAVCEILYSIMQSGKYLNNPAPISIFGATTEPNKITEPLYDRFFIKCNIDFYEDHEILYIINEEAEQKGYKFDTIDTLTHIALMSKNTPRIGLNLLKYCSMLSDIITPETINKCQDNFKLDCFGFNREEIDYLYNLYTVMPKTLSLANVSAMNRTSKENIEAIERYLLYKKFIMIGARGRYITDQGLEFLQDYYLVNEEKVSA